MSRKITSILIANRGEIALRIIRACRDLGIKSIAIYSDEDVRAVHVKRADEAYHIGPAAPAQSYLNMTKIVETAKAAGADAIHPGYGFLSENENFSDMCEKNDIIFIGPTSKAMELTGDKMKCKAIMKKAKVPTVPGSDGIVEDVEEAADIAEEAGYPVLLKSAFGGGGRGIRLANDEKQLRQEFEMASAESRAAFGKAALFVEKYLERIRHIEFQLIRDSHGNSRHLFERECSIQRRHQKLIEMSPSPVVDQKTRDRIGEIAVRAVDAVDYLNAGTAEFLRDPQGNPFKQQDLKMNGCAIECRINAEDPFYEFAPSTGIVPNCNIPYGPGIRVDTYLYSGCNVSGYYDSLVAKLLAWGRNFDETRIRMKNALDEFMIEGINTTIPLYKTIMDDPNFIKGELSTDYLERFKILNKMNENAKKAAKQSAKAAVAAVLLQSEFVRRAEASQRSSMTKSKWKMMRA
jgi:acetyl-CoA/propionyl-CoA carboxylase